MIKKDKDSWIFPTRHGDASIKRKAMLANYVVFPWEYNPNRIRPFLILSEFGPVALVWAEHEQDALDEAVDSNLMDGFQVSQEDYDKASEDEREDWTPLGNAGEPFDLSNVDIAELDASKFPPELVALFASAREGGHDTIDF